MSNKIISVLLLIFLSLQTFAAALPDWYKMADAERLAQNRAQKSGMDRSLRLENTSGSAVVVKFDTHDITWTRARFEGGDSRASYGYDVLALYGSAPERKLLFQVVDETGCATNTVDNLDVEKIGSVDSVGVYWVVVKIKKPSCQSAKNAKARETYLLLSDQKGLKKIYQSGPVDASSESAEMIGGRIVIERSHDAAVSNVIYKWDKKKRAFKNQK